MSNEIWLSNPTILLNQDKLGELWPTPNMSLEEKINAITRLIILLTIIGYLITLRFNIIIIGVITLLSIILLYTLQSKKKESFTNNLINNGPLLSNSLFYEMNRNNFDSPTSENPLMNVLIPEVYHNPERKAAAPTFNPIVENEINESVKQFVSNEFGDDDVKDKLFGSLGDKLSFNRSMLPFTATANTTIPNDQKNFQEFLYGDMISAKEGNPLALERNQSGAYNYTNY